MSRSRHENSRPVAHFFIRALILSLKGDCMQVSARNDLPRYLAWASLSRSLYHGTKRRVSRPNPIDGRVTCQKKETEIRSTSSAAVMGRGGYDATERSRRRIKCMSRVATSRQTGILLESASKADRNTSYACKQSTSQLKPERDPCRTRCYSVGLARIGTRCCWSVVQVALILSARSMRRSTYPS